MNSYFGSHDLHRMDLEMVTQRHCLTRCSAPSFFPLATATAVTPVAAALTALIRNALVVSVPPPMRRRIQHEEVVVGSDGRGNDVAVVRIRHTVIATVCAAALRASTVCGALLPAAVVEEALRLGAVAPHADRGIVLHGAHVGADELRVAHIVSVS
ncbi:uncharacterized protein M421DRAFT_333138 [Didymella exigua CBS 183.55]|uniref:Uncharacterized protein n=1 Tax=Didymella exigua CBS 183.55 TaxID=1150837 RepID=A0A6A5R4Q0_9PLEO|nr:uncharacterized protein M421DRAFT_333138 [Didymella exigua CBS 183.55]KAF1923085.1 hypothetical protein M421DRAFT_333138 [Didymella exigua CBS 183.55]